MEVRVVVRWAGPARPTSTSSAGRQARAVGRGGSYVDYQFNLLSGDYKSTYKFGAGQPRGLDDHDAYYHAPFRRPLDDARCRSPRAASGADILDRHKSLFAPGNCVRSVDTFSNGEGAFIANKNGPVRAIRSYIGANCGPTATRASSSPTPPGRHAPSCACTRSRASWTSSTTAPPPRAWHTATIRQPRHDQSAACPTSPPRSGGLGELDGPRVVRHRDSFGTNIALD